MSVVADLGDSINPLGFLFWYQFAGFVTAMSLGFLALMLVFHYLA